MPNKLNILLTFSLQFVIKRVMSFQYVKKGKFIENESIKEVMFFVSVLRMIFLHSFYIFFFQYIEKSDKFLKKKEGGDSDLSDK